MPGHIEKRSNEKNLWTIVVETGRDPVSGKRKRIKKYFKGTKGAAEKEMSRIVTELEQGTFIKPDKISYGEYMQNWLSDYAKINVAPTTYERYQGIVEDRVIPELGGVPLNDLKPMHLQKFYANLLKDGSRMDGRPGGLSPKTVLQVHRIFHKALVNAVKWQMTRHNPADAVSPPRKADPEMEILNESQIFDLFRLAEKKAPKYYCVVLIAATTGLRRGEIIGLRWRDLDLVKGYATVMQSVQYTKDKGLFTKAPKRKSKRTIPITPRLIQEFKKLKIEQNKTKLTMGPQYVDHDLVFCQLDGKLMNPSATTSWFIDFLKENDLPKIRFHDLRHTFASILVKLGVHSRVVSWLLGHSDIGITMNYYSRLMPGVQEDAIGRLERAIFGEDCIIESEGEGT